MKEYILNTPNDFLNKLNAKNQIEELVNEVNDLKKKHEKLKKNHNELQNKVEMLNNNRNEDIKMSLIMHDDLY
jgi:peptidoglycan hydrolase CwlO-like protein